MATFRYEGVNLAGEKLRGEMQAADNNAVADHLHRLGYMTVTTRQKTATWFGLSRDHAVFGSARPSTGDIAFFTRELATMLQAGLSLEPGGRRRLSHVGDGW